jgi:hypothetical protein
MQWYGESYDTADRILGKESRVPSSSLTDSKETLKFLLEFQHTTCVVARDLIHAFLSVASADALPSADYHLSANGVFYAFAIGLVERYALGKLYHTV